MKDEPTDASPTTARIARRVAALRQQRGLSLDALSERCGVSRSMISLVERGESSASAVVLERLAAGLGVALASLFEDDAAPASPLSRRDAQLTWRDPASGYLRRNLSPPNHPSPIHLVAVELPGLTSILYDTPPRERALQQQIFVTEGVLEVRCGDDPVLRLEPGDCLAMSLDRPNGYRNPGRTPARYIVAIARS